MASVFPGPVLAVASDVVRHLEGEEALPILWTLFTKCKESLKDGHRLENISWRLWHKSMAVTALTTGDAPWTKSLVADDALLSEKAYCPPTPEEIPQLPPITFDTMSNVPLSAQGNTSPLDSSQQLDQFSKAISSLHAPSLSHSFSRRTVPRRNSMRKGSTPVSVGKILCELLPTATVSSLSSLVPIPNGASTLPLSTLPPTRPGDPPISPSISLPLSSQYSHLATSLSTMSTIGQATVPPTSLPTPEAELDCSSLQQTVSTHPDTASHPAVVPVITTDDSSPLENSNVRPVPENRDQSTVPPPPPRLVVVNPTPNPTPHPTPPATPVLHPPIASHMKPEGEAAPTPLLRVPGQDALVQAQARARSNQMNSKLRLLVHDSGQEGKSPDPDLGLTGNMVPESSILSEAPPPSATLSCESSENTVSSSKRHSISSDITASSSSQSSPSSPSNYSKTTSATTISEPFRFTDLKKLETSPILRDSAAVHMDTDLSPTSPSYGPQSVSTHGSLESVSQKGKGKSGATGSSAEKGLSGPSTSRHSIPNRGLPLPAHAVNPARKSSTGNPVSRSRLARQDSTTSANSRSRSRTRDNSTSALSALAMTRGASGKGPKRGRAVGVSRATRAKALSRKQSLNLNETFKASAEELKRAIMFNIGSGSEEGSHAGSKSTGSGSENYAKEGNAVPQTTQPKSMKGGAGSSLRKGKEAMPAAPVPVEDNVKSPRKSQTKGRERDVVMPADQEKGKGKGKDKAKSPGTGGSVVALHVEATIADPLLPGSARRQIVITSDSDDFETETESFSGDESADVPLSASQQQLQLKLELLQQQKQQQRHQQQLLQLQLQKQQQVQQQQQQRQPQQARPHPPPLNRTQSHNIPRTQKQRLAEQRAAENERWEREMFTKLPKSSFQDLAQAARTNSTGLLSVLLNPDPQRLPLDHPYRRGFSSGMIQPLRPLTALPPAHQLPPQQRQCLPQQSQPQPPPAPSQLPAQPPPQTTDPQRDPNAQLSRHSQQPSRNHRLPKCMAALTNPSVGATAKTPVAPAMMSELLVGSTSTRQVTTSAGISVNGSAGKYKPKARPPEVVMEDTSDSESDDDNQMDLSKSVAQEKLKALLDAKKLKKAVQVLEPAKEDRCEAAASPPQEVSGQPAEAISIPPPRLLYPYNLPPPNPPTTPRTTRRMMLAVEIPESLRRNLLWERQVSQAHQKVPKRATSSTDVVKGWHVPNVVKLTPKGVNPEEPQVTKEEKRARFLARTRSFAFDYHTSGW